MRGPGRDPCRRPSPTLPERPMSDRTDVATVRRGEFVQLRPLVESDAERTLAWRHSDRAALMNRGAETPEAQAEWIRARRSTEQNFVIELVDGTPVGMI